MSVASCIRRVGIGLALAGVAALVSPAVASDWPGYRHDASRCAYTDDQVGAAPRTLWTRRPHHAPRPAWPDPVRERLLMAFDYASHVAAAGGVVYFGSSSDHAVYAVDLATGKLRWRRFTDGPVRFAPAVWHDRVFVASDDGWLYCLAAADGKLLWRFRGGPKDQRILGNEQMISRWPLRSGLAVVDDTIYFTAGMWPSEGVYAYALSAADGKVLWRTEDRAKFAPQGYLAAGGARLVAPAGRAAAWVIDRATGKASGGRGCGWAMVRNEWVLAGGPPFKANENLPAPGGPEFRERPEMIQAWRLGGKDKPRSLAGRSCAAADEDTCYAAGDGKVVAYALDTLSPKWEADCDEALAVIVSGGSVLVGGEDRVTAFSTESGQEQWSVAIDGAAYGLAVADGRLLVSTDAGSVVCLGDGEAATGADQPRTDSTPSFQDDEDAVALAKRIGKDTGVTSGLCLVLGAGDGTLLAALAHQSALRIFCAEPDAGKVAAARELLDAAGLYGTRVVVHQISPPSLPYPSYFANLVVVHEPSAGGAKAVAPGELYRVLHPYGGTVYVERARPSDKPRLWVQGPGLRRTILSARAECIVRGELAGAGQWTHQYADAGNAASSGDEHVKWPLQVLWFGKPGPGRMMNRHWRGTAPLFRDGRMFLLGQHSVIAVDAYNGRELWSRPVPSVQRRVVDIRGGNMVVDRDNVLIATGDLCLQLSTQTGQLARGFRLPFRRPQLELTDRPVVTVGRRGKVGLRKTASGVEFSLTAPPADGVADTRYSWELFVDARPADKRTGLYGPGAFHAVIGPGGKAAAGPVAPQAPLAVTADRAAGRMTVRLEWKHLSKAIGAVPAEFAFGVILNTLAADGTPAERAYRYANAASYRLANAAATVVVDPSAATVPRAEPALPASDEAEQLSWGYLAVADGFLFGTTVAQTDSPTALKYGWDFSSESHDYTGPPVAKVLGLLGLSGQTKCLFALEKATGRLRWSYRAAEAIDHNAIAIGGGRVYVIDKPVASPSVAPTARRRGQAAPSAPNGTLVALDVATGQRLWTVASLPGDYRQLRLGHGVLLAAGLSGMTAYAADGGRPLWRVDAHQPMHHCSAFARAPVITRRWVYDEPYAYDLRTGQRRTVAAAGGSGGQPWRWNGGRGCGTISASEHMLFYRVGAPALLDLTTDAEMHPFEGIRPGCYINMIPAGGLLLIPEAASGCGCPYNFQTTVALQPVPASRPE